MSYVDGNAVIGALSLALGTDTSRATVVCAACGHNHPVAEAHVYLRCPGIVIRCPNCTNREIILVEIGHRFELTINGVQQLEFPTGSRS
jgi:DNA-directed RNA polymerase subunit RPC12/RpoP